MQSREQLHSSRRWVVKVGSALLTDDGRGLNQDYIAALVAQIAEQRKAGRDIVLVSSGSVAEGMARLGWSQRPHALYELQAAAAIGQMGLVQAYESCFQEYGLHTAQVLLTHEDLADRARYLNARSTLLALLDLGIIPVVNENDTVATDEIRLGDNDTLAALVANLVEADLMLLLTDQDGLFDRDPRACTDAVLVTDACAGDAELEAMAGDTGGALGRGGMLTKIRAAERAARSGAATLIARGTASDILAQVAAGGPPGTFLTPARERLAARKQWLAGHVQTKGRLQLDEGAARVLVGSGSSLLSVGVTSVEGQFLRGDLVVCVTPEGREIARGLTNYSSDEARRIAGHPSEKIESLLGYVDEPELIHRDNLVVIDHG